MVIDQPLFNKKHLCGFQTIFKNNLGPNKYIFYVNIKKVKTVLSDLSGAITPCSLHFKNGKHLKTIASWYKRSKKTYDYILHRFLHAGQ